VVGHAGAALLRELADRLGLTKALGWHQAGGRHRHLDAVSAYTFTCRLAYGLTCRSAEASAPVRLS
jgi:hypothetical protein